MTWGKGLLDDDALQQQAIAEREKETVWGPGFDLPDAPAPVEIVAGEPTTANESTDNGGDLGMSVATLEQRLAADPTWWPEALELEALRPNPRKSALRAIRRTAVAESADQATLLSLENMLDSLA